MSNLIGTKKTQLIGVKTEDPKEIARKERLEYEKIIKDKQQEQQVKVNAYYKEFLNDPIDKEVNNFSFSGQQVLIKAFIYREKSTSGLVLDLEGTKESEMVMNFPIAKVLAVGDESKYKPGDIVKLRDFEASEVKNPTYEAWTKNNMSQGTLKQVGQAPPQYINNFNQIFGKKVFNLRPLDIDIDLNDLDTYEIVDPNIVSIINNPEKLL